MLSEVAEFFYTRVFSPRPLRRLVNRIILAVLPEQVNVNGAVVCLNRADPVVSGALTLKVYERKESRFVNDNLKQGSLFIDIGANVGYYTAMAMHMVGKHGRIIALEPDPISFACLERTIAANTSLTDVIPINMAATDCEGERELYVSSENRGDNRFHPFAASTSTVKTQTITVDGLLQRIFPETLPGELFIKIDVQGSEALVIGGMKQTLTHARSLTLLMEFWPQGLRNMGADPMQLMLDLEQMQLQLYELGESGVPVRISSKDDLINKYHGRKYTNIVAMRNAGV
jgi:FkbM family methyltransferase